LHQKKQQDDISMRLQILSDKILSAVTQAAAALMMQKLMNNGMDKNGQVDKVVALLNSSKSFLSLFLSHLIELFKYSL
jgi:hypothetical protein